MVALYADVQTASRKWSDSETRTSAALQLVVDAIIANDGGMDIFDKTPKGAEKNPICWNVERGILASFGKRAVKLADTPTKELSDKDKATKRYNRQQVGSRRDKVKLALDKRLNPDKYAKTKERTDDNVWFAEWLASGIKRAESSDTFNGDIVEVSEWMKASPLNK